MHLGKGSEFPPPAAGRKHLYSMQYCPFAERAKLALALKSIDHDKVCIQLYGDLPEWYPEKVNPKGKVPALVLEDGTVIDESADIVEFAMSYSDSKPTLRLLTEVEKGKHELLMDKFQSLTNAYFACFKERENLSGRKEELKDVMRYYEQNMNGPFLLGDDIKVTDVMLFPWFERLGGMFMICQEPFPSLEFPKIDAYIKKMRSIDALKSVIFPDERHYRAVTAYRAGQKFYDVE